MSVQKLSVQAYMVYGNPDQEQRRVEIISAVMNWGISEVPTAVVQVGVGRDSFDGSNQPDFDDTPQSDVRVRLYARLKGTQPNGEPYPDRDLLLFLGFINSMSASRISRGASGSLTIRHWLSSLQSSSLLASYAFPGSSAELTLPAYQRYKEDAGAKIDGNMNFGLLQRHIVYVDPGEIENGDIWTDIAKPFLIRVSKQNPFSKFSRTATCFPQAGGDNQEALDALGRIEGETPNYGLAPDQFGVLPKLNQLTPNSIITAIRSNITAPTVRSLMQHTAWSYIISHICSPFMCAVIPGVERARVVPIAPTIVGTFTELTVDDVVVVDRNRPIEHPYLAVTMSGGQLNDAGQNLSGGGEAQPFEFGPCYSPDKAPPNGMVHQIAPPAWLRDVQLSAFDPAITSRAVDGVPGGLMKPPETGSNSDQSGEDGEKAAQLRREIDDYGQDYVKSVYANDVLGPRQLKCVGQFRLDVGPGTQVKVIVDDDIPGFGNTVYAMVARVTLVLDAARPFAGSSYIMTHARNEEENAIDFMGVDKHPLFDQQFTGAPITDAL